jgi:uncharacterized SAM-binding protein YcdF (DUF218 family)
LKRKLTGIIILLGAPNDAAGKLSSLAVERCEQALLEYRANPGYAILPTGGFGEHFNRATQPHAFYTRCYLLEHSVPEQDILEPVYSSFTKEDASLSKPVVVSYGVRNVVVVTSDFHIARTKLIFGREFSGFQLSYRASQTMLSKRELDLLIQHERNALAAMKANPM